MSKTAKRDVFTFKTIHDETLLAEIATVEPYKHRAGTKERGNAWREVSVRLNNMTRLGFKTTQRSVRNRFEKLMDDFERKEKEEEKASGVEVEYTEVDQALQDIKERIAEVQEEQVIQQEKAKKEQSTAEEMRIKAMESLSETKKRMQGKSKDPESDEDDDDAVKVVSKKKKRKSQGSGMSDVLSDAMGVKKQANDIRQRELELKSEEIKQNQMFMQNILMQQQQFQQQQQAMNQALLHAVSNIINQQQQH